MDTINKSLLLQSIYSDGSSLFVSNVTPKKGEVIRIRIRTISLEEKLNIFLKTKEDGAERKIKMEYEETFGGLDYYGCNVICYEDVLAYSFMIVVGEGIYYYNQRGLFDYLVSQTYDFKILYNYNQPSWVKGTVFYQIFPERFCNGNKENDVLDNEYTFMGNPTIKREWNDEVLDYAHGKCLDFYGGDLEGVKSKIPYLKELGVNAIYLNPIFYAATNHKYDCLDYFTVDPHFGGDKALEDLCEELHKNDMKIILDVSINHTGTSHKWFNKEGLFFDKSIGAYNNKDSIERSYYFFNEDNTYKAWFDVESLPTLNYTSNELRDIIFKSKDSLVKKWLKAPYNIDGWRFDVADVMARNKMLQLHHELWPQITKSIKEENKNAYVLAEDWTDSHEFLNGYEWDSAMNYYGSCRPIREFLGLGDVFNSREKLLPLAKISSHQMRNRIEEYLAKIPFAISQNQFNLLDSHDIGRLHNREEISYDDYKGAVITLFTLIGGVNMYYGDEASIDGIDTNEGCRYPFPWDTLDERKKLDQYNLYHTLCHLKTTEDSLINGGMKFLDSSKNVLTFVRFTKESGYVTLFSQNENVEYVRIPLKVLGFSKIESLDVFNELVHYTFDNDDVIIKVLPRRSQLIKIH